MKLTKKDIPFLLALFSFGLFMVLFYIWAMPLIDPDEPRYASTARDMVQNGNWIVPHFNGAPRINKPPLFYWTVAVSYIIFGVNEFSSRLPSALAAIGTALVTYAWGKRFGGCKNGFWAAMALLASPLYFLVSRFCITDMLLSFFVCGSLYLFFVEYLEVKKSNLRRLLFYFLVSMVFLVKGPVGVLLILLIIFSYLLWMRNLHYIRRFWYLPGFLLFGCVICAWGVPFWLSLGTKQIFTLFTQETSGRFVSGYAHPEPFYYYVPVFLIGYFPWSLFVCAAFVYVLKKRKTLPLEDKKQVYFFASWLIVSLVFFSLSRSKLMTYILPVSPSLTLLSILLSRCETEGELWKGFKWVLWFVLGLLVAIPLVLIFTMQKWVPSKYGFSTPHVVVPIIILFAGTLLALFFFVITKRYAIVKMVFCFTNSFFLVVTIAISSRYIGTFRSTKDVMEKCLLYKHEDYMLLSYARIVPSLVFYSGKIVKDFAEDTPVRKLISNKNKDVYMVISLHDYQKKKEWTQKRKFKVICKNNAHVILKRESQ